MGRGRESPPDGRRVIPDKDDREGDGDRISISWMGVIWRIILDGWFARVDGAFSVFVVLLFIACTSRRGTRAGAAGGIGAGFLGTGGTISGGIYRDLRINVSNGLAWDWIDTYTWPGYHCVPLRVRAGR